jgi:DNA-binding XRE family transcriptional regulator
MRPQERAAARRQLDRRLKLLQNTNELARPSRGWVKAIRESLGMTTAQLARKLGVSQPRVVEIEKGEMTSAITLHSTRWSKNARPRSRGDA